jgi:hypothetical protein
VVSFLCKKSLFPYDTSTRIFYSNIGGPTLTIAALPRIGDHEQSVAFIELSQKFYLKDLNKIFDCCQLGCEKIRAILDEAIRGNAYENVNSNLTSN